MHAPVKLSIDTDFNMQPSRSNPPSGLAGNIALCLQPLTPLHMSILRKIESPVLLAFQMLMQGVKQPSPEIAAKLAACSDENQTVETREAVFVLTTPFGKLMRLKRLDRAAFRAAALTAIPDFSTPDERDCVKQSIGQHIDSGLRQLAIQNFKIDL